ncbi:MAG: prepilin-type N-terminal cleavage/methylation domain-containing protein [Planctomycetota bacterium]|jgi:Tfp pilus assembly protein PilV
MHATLAPRHGERGITLLEALVAMMLMALVVTSFIGIRTDALVDATQARNWRLAREIAEEKMSELQAGARETPPENGSKVTLEKYEGFSYKIVIGEAGVADIESEIATSSAGEDPEARDRADWQRRREDYRRASERGLSAMELSEQRAEDVNMRLAEKTPSETDFEEVAVVVYFPKIGASYEGEEDTLLIKARLSTLAIRGYTPQEAQQEGSTRGTSAAAAGLPGGGAAGSAGASGRGGGAPTGGSNAPTGTGTGK